MTKVDRLCAVRIGIDYWLMPEKDALRVFGALRGARRIERDYISQTSRWTLRDDGADCEIVAVRASDIHAPPRAPRLIGGY